MIILLNLSKRSLWKWFSKHVCNLLSSRTIHHFQESIFVVLGPDVVSEVMILESNVLGSWSEFWIFCNGYARLVVLMDFNNEMGIAIFD